MKVFNSDKLSPYGNITWMDKKDVERLIYVYRIQHDTEDFKPPSAWYCKDFLGNRLYFRARDRKKAQELLESFFGSAKYSLISDKHQAIR